MKKKESSFLLVSLDDDKAKKLANVISSDTARKILDTLTAGSLTETELSKRMGLPLSTIHYNLRQLVDSGLIESGEYHYSTRGREVAHYSLARKYIIIDPKSDDKLFSRFKSMLPAVVITTGIGLALFVWEKIRTAIQGATALAPESQTLKTFAQAAPMDTIPPQPSEPSVVIWFFAGMAAILACYSLFEIIFYIKTHR